MFDGEVDSEQFPIKSAVSGLSWFHLLGEKGDGMPCTIDVLLLTPCVRGVRHKTCWCIWFRIRKKSGIRKGVFGGIESS